MASSAIALWGKKNIKRRSEPIPEYSPGKKRPSKDTGNRILDEKSARSSLLADFFRLDSTSGVQGMIERSIRTIVFEI